DVIAGYDPKDPMTAFSAGRTPSKPYASFATARRLDGVRIGVLREYMNKKLFSKADEETIDIVDRGIAELRNLGATIVDPGPEGALFQDCINRLAPELYNAAFATQNQKLFPSTDKITTLLEMSADPKKVPESLTIRNLGGFGVAGEGKYMMNKYLRERG